MNILTMGVSGCGKSTIGKRIANHFQLPFIEGDDYHPPANVMKMAAGHPLTDEDRQPWLEVLAQHLQINEAKAESSSTPDTERPKTFGAVLACSALKEAYRTTLRKGLQRELIIIWLDGTREVLLARLQSRQDHFFPPHLLDSQLSTLEPPQDAIRIQIDQTVDDIVETVLDALSLV